MYLSTLSQSSRKKTQKREIVDAIDDKVIYYISVQGLSQDLKTGCPKLAIQRFWGILIFKGDHNILGLKKASYNVMEIILQIKKLKLCLQLKFEEISHKKVGVRKDDFWGFGLGCPNETQTTCWLRLIFHFHLFTCF